MKTKEDILKILDENSFEWCEDEVKEAKKIVRFFPEGTTRHGYTFVVFDPQAYKRNSSRLGTRRG